MANVTGVQECRVQMAVDALRRQRAAEVRKVELFDEAIAALTAYQEAEARR